MGLVFKDSATEGNKVGGPVGWPSRVAQSFLDSVSGILKQAKASHLYRVYPIYPNYENDVDLSSSNEMKWLLLGNQSALEISSSVGNKSLLGVSMVWRQNSKTQIGRLELYIWGGSQ